MSERTPGKSHAEPQPGVRTVKIVALVGPHDAPRHRIRRVVERAAGAEDGAPLGGGGHVSGSALGARGWIGEGKHNRAGVDLPHALQRALGEQPAHGGQAQQRGGAERVDGRLQGRAVGEVVAPKRGRGRAHPLLAGGGRPCGAHHAVRVHQTESAPRIGGRHPVALHGCAEGLRDAHPRAAGAADQEAL